MQHTATYFQLDNVNFEIGCVLSVVFVVASSLYAFSYCLIGLLSVKFVDKCFSMNCKDTNKYLIMHRQKNNGELTVLPVQLQGFRNGAYIKKI